MPYDPNIPTNGEIVDADELREQFAALHEENTATNARIEAIPAGPPGSQGSSGSDGATGGPGPQGPAFAQAIVEAVNQLEPGQPASVTTTFDGTNVRFTFNLPRGNDGPTGGQGSPGEVTAGQLAEAVAGTARDPVGVEPFAGTFSDPPTQGEMQTFAAWAETLRAGLRRG